MYKDRSVTVENGDSSKGIARGANGVVWVEEQLAREWGMHDKAIFFLNDAEEIHL